MSIKIVSDSSSNIFQLSDVPYAYVPMKVRSQNKEYIDTPELDVPAMVEELRAQNGPSSSSCPNTWEWLTAFEGAKEIFGIAITSKLSGSYSAAMQARAEYLSAHPEAKICILDSLSAGPGLQLLIEKLRQLILSGLPFEKIEETIRRYQEHTHLLFTLKSLLNFARNGRVNPAVAQLASVLGIQIVGKATDGTLDPLHKCRGEKHALKTIFKCMEKMGYSGGRVRIAHCLNPEAAEQLKAAILSVHAGADVLITQCKALCSYYAELGGMLIGFEDALADA